MKRITNALILIVMLAGFVLSACAGEPTEAPAAPAGVAVEVSKPQRDRDVMLHFSQRSDGIFVTVAEFDVADPEWATPELKMSGKNIPSLKFTWMGTEIPLKELKDLKGLDDYNIVPTVNGVSYIVDNIKVDPDGLGVHMEISKDPRK